MRKFFAMAKKGEISMKEAKKWTNETPNISSLPERVKKSKKRKR
jgi:hypothetical protein